MCFSLIMLISPIMFHLYLLRLKIWDADAMNMSVFSELHWCVIQLDRFREGPEQTAISQGLVSPLVFHSRTQVEYDLHTFMTSYLMNIRFFSCEAKLITCGTKTRCCSVPYCCSSPWLDIFNLPHLRWKHHPLWQRNANPFGHSSASRSVTLQSRCCIVLWKKSHKSEGIINYNYNWSLSFTGPTCSYSSYQKIYITSLYLSAGHLHLRLCEVKLEDFVDRPQKKTGWIPSIAIFLNKWNRYRYKTKYRCMHVVYIYILATYFSMFWTIKVQKIQQNHVCYTFSLFLAELKWRNPLNFWVSDPKQRQGSRRLPSKLPVS